MASAGVHGDLGVERAAGPDANQAGEEAAALVVVFGGVTTR